MTSKPALTTFIQEAPHLGNQFLEDSALLDYMPYFVPSDIINQAKPDLINLGHRVIHEIQEYGRDAERNPPRHEQFDAWANRIDVIHTSAGWKSLKRVSAEEGIVGFGYEKTYGIYQRLLQVIRLYIFSPSSGLFNCPLAMTDGAAFLLKNLLQREGDSLNPQAKKKIQKALRHLTTRDPNQFWTSGQWMTERRGGSDVSASTETVALQEKGHIYNLYGDKWFTSSTESEMCVTLARINTGKEEQKGGKQPPLSLFYVKTRNKTGKLNNIHIRRLKDKLGTKGVPTAELELHGTKATLISPEGRGVRYISDMLNITRMYNSAAAVGAMRRMIALARDWAQRRVAWGKKVSELPLQQQVIMQMEITFRGNLMFLLGMSGLLGKIEEGKSTPDEENIFRIMIPVLKLFTAKEAVRVCGEGIECFGGLGYMENSGIPVILRDVQVTTIWEGTTNVMCHDFIRALNLGKIDRLESFARYFRDSIGKIMQSDSNITSIHKDFREAALTLIESYNELYSDLHEICSNPKVLPTYEHHLREITFAIARVYIAIHLGLFAINSANTKDIYIFVQWISSYTPYRRYLSSKGKMQLDTKLIKEVALDGESKERHSHFKQGVDPKLLLRSKL